MGPFASKNVIKEIQIRQGKWVSVLGQISETVLLNETTAKKTSEAEPTKETKIFQTSETEPSEDTETMVTIAEEDSVAEKPKISAISQVTVFFIAVLGVLLVIALVLLFRGKASQ